MASLCNDNGLRRILVSLPDGSRPAIRLGRIPINKARGILSHVEHLEGAKFDGGTPPPQTMRWLAEVGDTLHKRLVLLGLAAPKVKAKRLTLGELVDLFKLRPNWREKKASTQRNYGMHFAYILAGLGADTPIDDVTEAAADDLPGYLAEPKPTGGGLCRARSDGSPAARRCCFGLPCGRV